MKIQHKYIRNRLIRIKNWKRIRNTRHPFETYFPYWFHGHLYRTYEEQVKENFEDIDKYARAMESGKGKFNLDWAPARFRREINKERKAQERCAMQKINNGRYDVEVPLFKRDAAWLYW